MNLFDTSDFPARWHCGNWSSLLGWTHIISDLLIFTAYVAIPLTIGFFILKKRDVTFPAIGWLFVAFIFCCGLVHLVEAGMFYWPAYRLSALVKATTAMVSLGTVVGLVQLAPKIMALPGITAMNRRLASEASERAKVVTQLESSERDLEERNREMEQFVYSVSHDLKAPLVTFKGFLGLLKEDLESGRAADALDSTARLENAADTMSALIGDILELSRIGRVPVEPVMVDSAGLAHACVTTLANQLEERNVKVHVSRNLPSVYADEKALRSILQNLLSNAIKYGCPDDGGRIDIGGIQAEGESRLFVRDDGPGIAEEHHERVFEVFRRLGTSEKGSGIGLALVEKSMRQQGGRVWLESKVGEGATFWLAFPNPPAGEVPAPAADDSGRGAASH